MNPKSTLEDQLKTLGSQLRERPALADEVMRKIRQSSADGLVRTPVNDRSAQRVRRRWPFLTAGLAAIVAMTAIAVITFPKSSVGWADVTKAIRAQNWIRGTVTFTDGKSGMMWLSPGQRIWAFKLDGSLYFYNGREHVKYELRAGDKSITKLPLGEDDAQRVLSMNALSQGKSPVGHWLFGTEKILSQERREVTDAGKTWLEFQMTLWRGDLNQATLRVDPETRLPVYLLLTSPQDAKKSIKWQFDYPADGPTDIYALGVPRETKIDDRMPSNDALAVLRGIAKSRAVIGDFRLLVGTYPGNFYFGSVVWRKGDRWRVDSYSPRGNVDPAVEPPTDQNWAQSFEERLQRSEPLPLYVCDGKTVWDNSNPLPGAKPQWQASPHVAPQDLMSGEGLGSLPRAPDVKIASRLFPELAPKFGWGFEFDPNPSDASGCVLIKRSLHNTFGTIGHEWYYVDPAKGDVVIRVELFNLPLRTLPEASRSQQTIRMEDFQKTKQGFWYPTVVRNTMDHRTTTIRYHFDFAADLPDSLFTVEKNQ